METYFVYYLLEPDTEQVRYIGISKDPANRIAQHLADDTETHKTHWIRSLARRGLCPRLVIKCIVEGIEEAYRTERKHAACWFS